MKHRKLAWAAAILAALVVVVWLVAPYGVRKYVERNYPEVVVHGGITIHWFSLSATFSDVEVTKPNLEARLTEVSVDRAKNVRVTGGYVNLDLPNVAAGAKAGTPPKGVAAVSAEDLTLHIKYRGAEIDLRGVSVDPKEVCFKTGLATYPRYKEVVAAVTFFDGCAKRDRSKALVSFASLSLPKSVKVPKVEGPLKLDLTNVLVDDDGVLIALVVLGRKGKDDPTPLVRLEHFSVDLKRSELQGDPRVHSMRATINHPWLANGPRTFNDVSARANLANLEAGSLYFIASLHRSDIAVDPEQRSIEGQSTCNSWVTSLPWPPPIAVQQLAGHFTGKLNFRVDLKPKVHISLKQDCKYTCTEVPLRELRESTFRYHIYDAHGNLKERVTGPGTRDWVPLSSLPVDVPNAFRLLEDPGFLSHRGIHVQALENSLKANLKKGAFVKGGSTISMQLAKNLWLDRSKTIERKVHEALLTLALESCLSKTQIMELYLNVIEFGPDLYGIGPASQHYFHKSAAALTATEAFYLAHLLPNPKKAVPPEAGGLDQVRGLMKRLATSGYIPEHLAVDDKTPVDLAGWDFDDY